MKKPAGENVLRRLFGNNMKRLRALQNISQMALSDRTGLTHNFINEIESGRKWVSANTLTRLAAALHAEPYQFFLPDTAPQENADTFFAVYLDNFSDNLQKMVGELKNRYLNGEV